MTLMVPFLFFPQHLNPFSFLADVEGVEINAGVGVGVSSFRTMGFSFSFSFSLTFSSIFSTIALTLMLLVESLRLLFGGSGVGDRKSVV